MASQAFMNYADGVLTCSAADSDPMDVRPSLWRNPRLLCLLDFVS